MAFKLTKSSISQIRLRPFPGERTSRETEGRARYGGADKSGKIWEVSQKKEEKQARLKSEGNESTCCVS